MDKNIQLNRRQLLSGIAGTTALPHVVASSVLGDSGSAAASERITIWEPSVSADGAKRPWRPL